MYYYEVYNSIRIQSDIPLNIEPISPLQECNFISEPNLVIKVENDLSIFQVCSKHLKDFSNVDRFYAKKDEDILYFKDVYYKRKYDILLAYFDEKYNYPTKIYATKATLNRSHSVLRGNLYNLIDAIIQIKLIQAGFLYVHAACLSKNGQSIVLAAHCGVGKSIASFQASKRGYNILSDDMTLIDSEGYGYFSCTPSTVSYNDFIRFVKAKDIGWWKYQRLLLRSKIVERNPWLMRFFPLPRINLLGRWNHKVLKSKVNTICVLEEGEKCIEKVDKEYLAKKINEINEYSLEKFDRNRMLWMYAFFNEFDMNKVRAHENENLLKFLDGCECYVLSCEDKNWIPLVGEII